MRRFKIFQSTTQRDSVIDRYLSEISKYDLLTAEQETELARRYRENKDTKALDRLINSNLRFVVSVAKNYQNQGLMLMDLINEGNAGVIKAAHSFDETRGFKFISYAVWWIRQSILQALAEHSRLVRLPVNRISQVSKYNKIYSTLEQRLGRVPDDNEIVKELKITMSEHSDMTGYMLKHSSLDARLSEDNVTTFVDVLEDEDFNNNPTDGLMKESLKQGIVAILYNKKEGCQLKKIEIDVLTMFFGIGMESSMSLEEISNRLIVNVGGKMRTYTPERIRQIKEEAIKKLSAGKNIFSEMAY